MPSWVVPALLLVATVTVVYLGCVRPMLPGRGRGSAAVPGSGPDELDREIATLREEVRILHAQDAPSRGRGRDQGASGDPARPGAAEQSSGPRSGSGRAQRGGAPSDGAS